MGTDKDEAYKVVCVNKKARQLYEVSETYEAGMVLLGTEIKSIRDGRVILKDAYAQFKDSELYLVKCHITPYAQAFYGNHKPERDRKLLLHKREIKKLIGRVTERGFTIIPLKIYFKWGRAKIEIGLAKGKKIYDHRKEIQERDMKRDVERTFKQRYR